MYVYKTWPVSALKDMVIVFPVAGSVIVNVLSLLTWSSFVYMLSNRRDALPKFCEPSSIGNMELPDVSKTPNRPPSK
jgi:hypothetical protein